MQKVYISFWVILEIEICLDKEIDFKIKNILKYN